MSNRAHVVALDKRFVWHPYTEMGNYIAHTQPLVIERARGARLYDADGSSYLDANSSWWTSLLGHNHPRLVQALQRAAERMCHVSLAGITHEPAALLAERLVTVTPASLCKVFYSDDGSTAVEVALKMSLQYWAQNGRPSRKRFIALSHAFHGETLGVTALGGVDVFRMMFGSVLMDCVHVPTSEAGFEQAFAIIERLLSESEDEVAAVVVEPMVQGAGGMRMYSAEYLRQVRELTARHDVFLIADEVFTGYGRTGPMWACEHAAVEPDFLCTAKGFTAGILPMAATLTTQRVFDGFLGSPERALYYGHTYCGHPLGAAVALEVLSIYEEERVLEQARRNAELLGSGIERLATLPGVTEPGALGMVGRVRLGAEDSYLEQAGWRVYHEALLRGAYVRPLGNVVYLAPPLNISRDDLGELLDIVYASVQVALRG